MSVVYLQLVSDATIRGITSSHGIQVFSVYDFINLVCRKTGKYANRVWRHLIRDTSKFVEFKEDLVLAVPSTNIMKRTTHCHGTAKTAVHARQKSD